MELNNLEDEELDINDVLQEQDIWLEDLETDAWLMPGPMLDEGEQLIRNSTIGSNTGRKQIAPSKLLGLDSKRGARFKTQVIKYEEPPPSLGGGDEDLDLEPPPSLSSLDDFSFVPEKIPTSRVTGLDVTFSASPPTLGALVTVSHTAADHLPEAMTATYNVETSGALDAKPAAHKPIEHKNVYLEKIKAIRQKYATPKGPKTVISQVSESDEGELSNGFQNKLSLVNQQLEEVNPDEGRRLSSSGKFLFNSPDLGSHSTAPKRLSLGSPSTIPNRLSLNSPVGVNRTLTLTNQKIEDGLLSDNKLSRMNENLFVATSPSPMVETKRFILPSVSSTATNGPLPSDPTPVLSAISSNETADPSIPPKPKLKKQRTFEILDNENDDDAGGDNGSGDEDENRYQTMVLPGVDGDGINGNQNSEDSEMPFAVSFSSTPKECRTVSKQPMVNSHTITKNSFPSLYQENGLNTSFTIERHEDLDAVSNVKSILENANAKSYLTMTYLEDNRSSKANVSSTRLNGSLTYSRESNSSANSKSNTSVTYLNGGDPNDDLVNQNVLNTSYSKTSKESQQNMNRSRNDLNRSYTVSTDITEDESDEEFNATEAESNEEYRVTEAHRNMLNKSFTLLSALENAVEESEHINQPALDDNGDAHTNDGLNTSFTVKKHYEETITYSDQNRIDSNDINDNPYANSVHRKNVNENLVNGKSRGNSTCAVSKTDYPTFTRRGKIPTGPGAYRNGTSGLLQKKTLVRPSTGYGAVGANLNSTFKPLESNLNETRTVNLNETVQISANNASRFGPSRFSTVTRNKDNTRHNPSVQDNTLAGDPNETVHINRFSTITRPKSKLSYVGQKQAGANRMSTVITVSGVARCKNSSSTESLKSNESYVISRPNGLAPRGSIPKRPIYKSTGALNVGGAPGPVTSYSRVQSTDNLSVKSGGSDSEGSSVGGSSAVPRPSGLVRPGFSRIPAPPSSRIPAAAKPNMIRPTSMLNRYSATRKV